LALTLTLAGEGQGSRQRHTIALERRVGGHNLAHAASDAWYREHCTPLISEVPCKEIILFSANNKYMTKLKNESILMKLCRNRQIYNLQYWFNFDNCRLQNLVKLRLRLGATALSTSR
jgi:hypothetical protein